MGQSFLIYINRCLRWCSWPGRCVVDWRCTSRQAGHLEIEGCTDQHHRFAAVGLVERAVGDMADLEIHMAALPAECAHEFVGTAQGLGTAAVHRWLKTEEQRSVPTGVVAIVNSCTTSDQPY